jgi:hypothetical protein
MSFYEGYELRLWAFMKAMSRVEVMGFYEGYELRLWAL